MSMMSRPMHSETTYQIVKIANGYRMDSVVVITYENNKVHTFRNYVAQHHNLQFLQRMANKLNEGANVLIPQDYIP